VAAERLILGSSLKQCTSKVCLQDQSLYLLSFFFVVSTNESCDCISLPLTCGRVNCLLPCEPTDGHHHVLTCLLLWWEEEILSATGISVWFHGRERSAVGQVRSGNAWVIGKCKGQWRIAGSRTLQERGAHPQVGVHEKDCGGGFVECLPTKMGDINIPLT
jgi:hypothetical protein